MLWSFPGKYLCKVDLTDLQRILPWKNWEVIIFLATMPK